MGKAFADPLFVVLALSFALQSTLYRNWGRLRGRGRLGLVLLTGLTAGMWLLGTHEVESRLVDGLNRIHPVPPPQAVADIDVVIVLSGGYVDAPNRTYDQLDHWSTARVIQGVRTYFESGARLLVVSGRGGPVSAVADRGLAADGASAELGEGSTAADGAAEIGARAVPGAQANPEPNPGAKPETDSAPAPGPERLARGMKRLAVELGVPPERVIEEPFARTTREHPVELLRLDVVGPDDTVGVVTSSWHLPRAMAEFDKHFDRVVPVPAFDVAIHRKTGLLRWMPRSLSLANSATAIAEYIGMVWYRMPFSNRNTLVRPRGSTAARF